jgi:predicted metal-dependent phosphoesterase TrpH
VKKLVIVTAAVVAAVAVLVGVTAPPRRLSLPPAADGTVAGILHVHTNRSDGLSSPDEIAAAAARAGLKFVVFTDHGDATRRPDPPQYRSGVLCVDGVEISTSGGHYIAIDMPASPYPLAGEPRDVVEDVRRLGGFGIAAHPDSPKLELKWREWAAPIDGVELLNPDTAWRVWLDHARNAATKWAARRRLAFALADYAYRPAEVMASLIEPSGAFYNWEALTRRRRVVALAGVDAHAKLAPRSADPGDSRFALPFPGYESSFRILSVHVRTDRPLSATDADADAAMLMRAIRSGHLYTAVDAVATPASFEFTASNEHGTVHEGDELGAGGPITLRVRSNAPPGFTTAVWKGAAVLSADHHEPEFTIGTTGEPAVYWVEIRATGQPNPLAWIRSNAIYVRSAEALTRVPVRPPPTVVEPIFDTRTTTGWRAEHDPTSVVALETAPIVGGADLRLRYGLAGGAPAGQVVALAHDTPSGVAPNDRVIVSIRAEHPMRISLQLRTGGDGEQQRWQRSIYVDPVQQEHTIYFDDMMPVGRTETFKPDLSNIRSILFVIDATHTRPGDSGRIWIRRVELGH